MRLTFSIIYTFFQSYKSMDVSAGLKINIKVLSVGHQNERVAKGQLKIHRPGTSHHLKDQKKAHKKIIFYLIIDLKLNSVLFFKGPICSFTDNFYGYTKKY